SPDDEREAPGLPPARQLSVALTYKSGLLHTRFNPAPRLNNLQHRLFGFFGPHLNQERTAIVQLMQRFEDANKIDTAFAKRHIAELSGAMFGNGLSVFQVDGGDTVDAQFQFG